MGWLKLKWWLKWKWAVFKQLVHHHEGLVVQLCSVALEELDRPHELCAMAAEECFLGKTPSINRGKTRGGRQWLTISHTVDGWIRARKMPYIPFWYCATKRI